MLMDKNHSSRPRKQSAGGSRALTFLLLGWALLQSQTLAAINLSHDDALRIGKKIWQNECNGTVSGLTSWNEGESFASLGIGHFIWYPKNQRGPFEESFPRLIDFMITRGVKLPASLSGANEQPCPWNSRAEFLRAQRSPEMKELRQFLADTADLQAEFLIARLQNALPKMLDEAAPADRGNIQRQFERMASTPQGCYALVDYVNFKGEGVLHSERYQGQGWGLLQVLEQMRSDDGHPVTEFSSAAVAVLKQRVANSPPERGERRWLVGWLNRVRGYNRG